MKEFKYKYPTNTKVIIKRVMYKTDKDFKKGMTVALLDGEIIAKHFDTGKLNIPPEYCNQTFYTLDYYETDWELAGYKLNKKDKEQWERLKKDAPKFV